MGRITKQRIGNELYVYFNGHLIYKRWYGNNYKSCNRKDSNSIYYTSKVMYESETW